MAIPDLDRARAILRSYELPDGIVVHSEGVRRVAAEAAGALAEAGVPVDGGLVEAAALLHDIDKPATRGSLQHGLLGAAWLERAGYGDLAAPVASHPLSCLLDEERFPRGWPSVLVAVADRHVAQEFLSVDRRLDEMIERHPEHRASIERARPAAHSLEAQLAEVVEQKVDTLVERLRAAWEAGR
jgi:putative nucleotidyltransferase with HDIG domain